MSVRTRFAPSPTGYLHIGGVRTALFCWLFARRHGGQFILRIDDTDQERNVQEALSPILHGLRWLGIDWDEGPEVGGPHAPYYQSQRSARYQAAVERLLAAGAAYYDYATPEELQAERQAAEQAKQPFLYSRRFLAETPAQRERFEAQGRRAVVRLKMPRQGTLAIDDLVRGRVEIQWAREQDHVIQRADGTCLYHLASVVDDYEFQITHVIRAEEHLSNTPRQVFIIQSLGYPLPQYAHLPFVAEPGSKNKLSKRKLDKYLKNRDFAQMVEHGRAVLQRLGLTPTPEQLNPVMVEFYQRVGYLPEAIVNYLALLGWSLDDKSEHFSRQQLIENFSLERVTKAAASFDPKKLWAFEDRHFQALPLERKVALVLPFLQMAGLLPLPSPSGRGAGGEGLAGGEGVAVAAADADKIARILTAAGDRIKVSGDILAYADFFFIADDQLLYDETAFDKRLRAPGAAPLVAKFKDRLAAAESFEPAALEALLHEFIAAEGIQPGAIIHALRVAATGKAVGPGLFDCLAILGKAAVLARMERALNRIDRA
jgi:glutamyl-tRNA synthetase